MNQPYTPDSPEVVALIYKALAHVKPGCGVCRPYGLGLDEVLASALNDAKEAGRAEAQAWIPVTTKTMPDEDTDVLVFSGGCQGVGSWPNMQGKPELWFVDDGSWYSPTHWMPLPQAPKP